MKMTVHEFNERRRAIEAKHEGIRRKIYKEDVKSNNDIWTREVHQKMNADRELEWSEIADLRKEYYLGVEVGDGVTVHLWSDAHAYTVIKRTAKTITIQQDEAILDPDFKPEWIPGGFAGHCTNQDDQAYTYKRNPRGEVLTIRWSDKYSSWRYLDKALTMGRHEYYDYNF